MRNRTGKTFIILHVVFMIALAVTMCMYMIISDFDAEGFHGLGVFGIVLLIDPVLLVLGITWFVLGRNYDIPLLVKSMPLVAIPILTILAYWGAKYQEVGYVALGITITLGLFMYNFGLFKHQFSKKR